MSKTISENVCDDTVFKRIYNAIGTDLYNFLYYKYGNQFNPDDKAQEAFIKLWDNCHKVTLEKAKSFLFTVANNLVLNDIKHQKVVLKFQNQKQRQHTYESPEFLLEKEQFSKRYQEILGQLKEEQRVAFLLNKVEDKSHKEIAQLLNVTQKVVEYRIYSAFKILRENLDGFKLK